MGDVENCPICCGTGWMHPDDPAGKCQMCNGTGGVPVPTPDPVDAALDVWFKGLYKREIDADPQWRARMRRVLDAHDAGKIALLSTLYNIAEAAPELNMSNYDHDQVSELNAAMTEVFLLLKAALQVSTPRDATLAAIESAKEGK